MLHQEDMPVAALPARKVSMGVRPQPRQRIYELLAILNLNTCVTSSLATRNSDVRHNSITTNNADGGDDGSNELFFSAHC